MEDISKDSISIYLFNAYSNLDFQKDFISGSDRVGIKLIENEQSYVFVIAPINFKRYLPDNINFLISDDLKLRFLPFNYIVRVLKSIYIIYRLLRDFKQKVPKIKIMSTSDFFPDVIPAFLFSNKIEWYAFSFHLYPKDYRLRNLLGRLFQNASFLLFSKSFKVVTTSMELYQLFKSKLKLKRVLRIPLGIDLNLYNSQKNKIHDLIYLGRIKESKGVFDLPFIVSCLIKDNPFIKLRIIGNGSPSDLEKLTNLIGYYKLENNIEILSNLSDESVRDLLSETKVLLQPSSEEGFGLSVLEALASGMKIVLYDLPVYSEHFSEFKLNFVPSGSKLDFYEEVQKVLSENLNVSYPPKLFKKFSWGEIFVKIFLISRETDYEKI